jgi:deazaflavin-dependent oxidoreductase (nitroreductase family)
MHSSGSSSDASPEAPTYKNTFLRRCGNVAIAPLARVGLAGKRTHILTVTGRKTGRRYSTPVQLIFLDGQRWLVSPYGERQWVKNVRAAGAAELMRARRTERVRLEEVDASAAAPVLAEYFRKTPITRRYDTGDPARHPVFRIVS